MSPWLKSKESRADACLSADRHPGDNPARRRRNAAGGRPYRPAVAADLKLVCAAITNTVVANQAEG